MRAASLILALVLQSVAAVCMAQDADAPVKKPIPEEHRDFVTEIQSVFEKYPEASASYKLIDYPASKERTCHEECKVDWHDFWEYCRCVPPQQ